MDAGRLINTETLVRILCGSCTKGDGEGACAQLCPVISAIEKTPTANAVRVVRCAECIEYELDCGYCDYWEVGRRVDDYCSRGKRKGNSEKL